MPPKWRCEHTGKLCPNANACRCKRAREKIAAAATAARAVAGPLAPGPAACAAAAAAWCAVAVTTVLAVAAALRIQFKPINPGTQVTLFDAFKQPAPEREAPRIITCADISSSLFWFRKKENHIELPSKEREAVYNKCQSDAAHLCKTASKTDLIQFYDIFQQQSNAIPICTLPCCLQL